MSSVTKHGLDGVRPGREATTGVHIGPGGTLSEHGPTWAGAGRSAEQPMVPKAEFTSYYGMPIINRPVWEAPDIPGYLFLGGLAGAGSALAAAAQLTGRRGLALGTKLGSTAAAGLSLVALVHDLGRRGRFLNMLRTFKPTSPMSVGSWLLAAYAPASALSAGSQLTGLAPGLGALATTGAALVGPAVATYTGALISNTAVPAWHDGYRQMPFVFAASALSSAAGLGLLVGPSAEVGPVRRLGVATAALELAGEQVLEKGIGLSGEAYEQGKARRYGLVSKVATGLGIAGALVGRDRPILTRLSGAAMLVGAAAGRFAIFEAGLTSADDPKYTVVPQRARLEAAKGQAS